MTKQTDFQAMLQEPAKQINGMIYDVGATQRLSMAMRQASAADPTNVPAQPASYSSSRVGVPNPYGSGVAAFEPNNIIFDAYKQAKGTADASAAKDQAEKDGQINLTMGDSAGGGAGGATLGAADGQLGKAVSAAMALAQRAVPYVWGGTGPNGVDCSGLIYYAYRSAGINIPRYRAIDYAHIGQAVPDVGSARPGDVIYFDEPGTDTDHVGLYVGNGLMIQAPQTGDHVRVTPVGKPTSIRRIYDDASFGQILQPDGSAATAYNGQPYNPGFRAQVSPPIVPLGSTLYTPPYGRGSRAI